MICMQYTIISYQVIGLPYLLIIISIEVEVGIEPDNIIIICHMGSHKMKVADSALYTVTRTSGMIFLIISPYFLCDISHITPRGQSQKNYGHSLHVTKHLDTWQRAQVHVWGIPSAVLIALQGYHAPRALYIKTASGIYPISRLLPCINYY